MAATKPPPPPPKKTDTTGILLLLFLFFLNGIFIHKSIVCVLNPIPCFVRAASPAAAAPADDWFADAGAAPPAGGSDEWANF